MIEYARWLSDRIPKLGTPDYQPTIFFDLNGSAGNLYDNSLGKIMAFLLRLKLALGQYPVCVTDPMILETREEQRKEMARLRQYFRFRNIKVQLAATAWIHTLDDVRACFSPQSADLVHINMADFGSVHNAIEAALECKSAGLGVMLGGRSTETDLSARVACQIGLAVQPDFLMARPGLGVEENVALMRNEMTRTLAWIRSRQSKLGDSDSSS